jgi:hypothetical protein
VAAEAVAAGTPLPRTCGAPVDALASPLGVGVEVALLVGEPGVASFLLGSCAPEHPAATTAVASIRPVQEVTVLTAPPLLLQQRC